MLWSLHNLCLALTQGANGSAHGCRSGDCRCSGVRLQRRRAKQAPHGLEFPKQDGPHAILLPNILKAHEEVSRGFRFEVEVLSDDARIPLKAMMARMVTISLVRAGGTLRYFNGYVTEFRFLRADGGFAFYQMVLEPWLAFARLRQDNVSFHGKSARQITEETLQHYRQADWHMHTFEDDPVLAVANQHNETDYNHLHRRWEARGMHYWYEHRADGHILMLSDSSLLAEPIDVDRHYDADVIGFRAESGSVEDDGIHCWSPIRRLGSGITTLASFDYKNPFSQFAEGESANAQGDFFAHEVYENTGAHGFHTHSDGEKLAQQRMVERDKDIQTFEAQGNDRTVQPGRVFKLGGHFSAKPAPGPMPPEPRRTIGNRDYLILRYDAASSKPEPMQYMGFTLSHRNSPPCACSMTSQLPPAAVRSMSRMKTLRPQVN
jgi:type VI secretion system secreted protein VgrG